ncbi:MAG: glycoside hydrolase family 15 protein [Pseudohongiellaceae bacterium]
MKPALIGDYALIGNLRTVALVSKTGSIDWFCPVKFDTSACFAALLGSEQNGQWLITPTEECESERFYLANTLVLETRFHGSAGSVSITDFMPLQGCSLIRIVRGLSGNLTMRMNCAPRFEYGLATPGIDAGKQVKFYHDDEQLLLSSDISLTDKHLENDQLSIKFNVAGGDQHWFVLSHHECDRPDRLAWAADTDAFAAQSQCVKWWEDWADKNSYDGRWGDVVMRSLITLKALTYQPSGAMVAAATTSLPEIPGGDANWDYRFCWLRDATLVLDVLLTCNYQSEATAWLDWLEDALRNHDGPLRTLYTIEGRIAGEEAILEQLPGYLNSRPVRVGNAASRQYQMDLRGELMDVLHVARNSGLKLQPGVWELQCRVLDHLEARWREPDAGFWEVRGPYRQLTLSKVMAWVAFDRSIQDARRFNLPAPIERWCQTRDEIRQQVLSHGVHSEHGYFTQQFDTEDLDASLLMIPLVGFLPATDRRMIKTVTAIEQQLCKNGFVYRYSGELNRCNVESTGNEGAFLLCSFWLADNYLLAGRHQDAEDLFERLLDLCNDVGLMAEQYDPVNRQFLGNFPQSLTHLGLINSARLIGSHSQAQRSG